MKSSHEVTVYNMTKQMNMLTMHLAVIQSTCSRHVDRSAELQFFCEMFAESNVEFVDQDELLRSFRKKIMEGIYI